MYFTFRVPSQCFWSSKSTDATTRPSKTPPLSLRKLKKPDLTSTPEPSNSISKWIKFAPDQTWLGFQLRVCDETSADQRDSAFCELLDFGRLVTIWFRRWGRPCRLRCKLPHSRPWWLKNVVMINQVVIGVQPDGVDLRLDQRELCRRARSADDRHGRSLQKRARNDRQDDARLQPPTPGRKFSTSQFSDCKFNATLPRSSQLNWRRLYPVWWRWSRSFWRNEKSNRKDGGWKIIHYIYTVFTSA